LEGVWLVGWPGGELHYSVLRFPPSMGMATTWLASLEVLLETAVEKAAQARDRSHR
jgi:hypothetical protein